MLRSCKTRTIQAGLATRVQSPQLRLSSACNRSRPTIYTPADIDNTFDVLTHEPNGGLLVLPDTFNTVHRAKIIALAARHRIPAVYPQRFYATDGGLMAYGAISGVVTTCCLLR